MGGRGFTFSHSFRFIYHSATLRHITHILSLSLIFFPLHSSLSLFHSFLSPHQTNKKKNNNSWTPHPPSTADPPPLPPTASSVATPPPLPHPPPLPTSSAKPSFSGPPIPLNRNPNTTLPRPKPASATSIAPSIPESSSCSRSRIPVAACSAASPLFKPPREWWFRRCPGRRLPTTSRSPRLPESSSNRRPSRSRFWLRPAPPGAATPTNSRAWSMTTSTTTRRCCLRTKLWREAPGFRPKPLFRCWKELGEPSKGGISVRLETPFCVKPVFLID